MNLVLFKLATQFPGLCTQQVYWPVPVVCALKVDLGTRIPVASFHYILWYEV